MLLGPSGLSQKAVWQQGGREEVSGKPGTHRKMRKLETPNMMKVIPVPRATMARVESGAEGKKGTLRKTVWSCENGRG